MTLHLTELQQITLRDVLTTAGLTARQVEDIFLLLSFKAQRVQRIFYLRAQSMTYEDIAKEMGEDKQAVHYILKSACNDIRQYLVKTIFDKP